MSIVRSSWVCAQLVLDPIKSGGGERNSSLTVKEQWFEQIGLFIGGGQIWRTLANSKERWRWRIFVRSISPNPIEMSLDWKFSPNLTEISWIWQISTGFGDNLHRFFAIADQMRLF